MGTQFDVEGFLFDNHTGRQLFESVARNLPVHDFHTHLSAADIALDRRFHNLTELTLESDHYRFRAMRARGVPEVLITGNAAAREKFQAWAETVPFAVGNPLVDWVQLELALVFGINEILDGSNAAAVWESSAEKLALPEFSARGLLLKQRVKVVCTTDDPLDNLAHHAALRTERFRVKVVPGFRADPLYAVGDPAGYNRYLDRLAEESGEMCRTLPGLIRAAETRMTHFHDHGCRILDLGLDRLRFLRDREKTTGCFRRAASVFRRLRRGRLVTDDERVCFTSVLLTELSRQAHARGWTQLLHIGPLRNVNSVSARRLGPNTGFDVIGDHSIIAPLAGFLNALADAGCLPRTIIYAINPADIPAVISLAGGFPKEKAEGWVQAGAPWWFSDHRAGIESFLDSLSAVGFLRPFSGMVSDSRSLLSFCRHEYFRRVFCNWIGRKRELGLLPAGDRTIRELVAAVAYDNAARDVRMGEEPAEEHGGKHGGKAE
ncbi:MAG TPA: glucuronate isomerase [Spirochaetia bacterium]|nr:glucuronate isomerase [Spirochaetia bacterium]